MSVSDNIKDLRIKYGLTQAELGEIAGVTDKAVSSWEKGNAEPRMGAIQKIAEHFNISKASLIADSDDEFIFPSARSLPIAGTICAGEGVICADDLQGRFIMDIKVDADFVLRVKGDSMKDADIHNKDYVFIKKDREMKNGDIYAVELLDTEEAVIRTVHKMDGSLLLSPCNPEYDPKVVSFDKVRFIGKVVGVYHGM